MDAALATICQVHEQEGPGDVLVFLTGQEEIQAVQHLLVDRRVWECFPCFSLSARQCQVLLHWSILPHIWVSAPWRLPFALLYGAWWVFLLDVRLEWTGLDKC